MANRYFTKFCGITTIKDAQNAEKAGCNALGFVFVKSSKRFISTTTCQKIITKLSPTTLVVALFANNSKTEVQQVLDKCTIHVLQFHGNESPEFCSQWNRPYWRAIPMADNIKPEEYIRKYPDAQAYLVDNYGKSKSGGSGNSFDWSKIPQNVNNKWILAGGLKPSNIKQAKKMCQIKCFDVSSGIEKSPGLKSNKKMIKFIEELND